MTIPKWADDLITEVCQDNRRSQPTKVSWYNGSSRYASGHWNRWRKLKQVITKLHVTAGTDPQDAKMVLLHELAHHINGQRGRRGHDMRFWTTAFTLYRKYGLEEYAMGREYEYRAKAKDGHEKAARKGQLNLTITL